MTLQRLSGDSLQAQRWCAQVAAAAHDTRVLLLLAGTATAAVPGISAAGATPESRRLTAAADAELLLLGPGHPRPHALPPLPAGVSPALISRVVVEQLALDPLVVDAGAAVPPAVPHLQLGHRPARCLSTGAAMEQQRVLALIALGRRWGRQLARRGQPLLLAECVPGGTSTAQAVLQGLGVPAAGLVSGSLRQPAHALKAQLVAQGLAAAQLPQHATAEQVLAAVGDPMQPLAAGLLLEAAVAGLPVLLAGGSQMAAVLAVALALAEPSQRSRLAACSAIATTAWVAGEPGSDLARLLDELRARWGPEPLAFAASLRFQGCASPQLLAFEQGYVKEGVGAGGLAALWELSGRMPQALAQACDQACRQLV
ncbi:TIGR00303 family protein [Synechococcus sp. HK05]|uniref:nicotinate mononucleotide-dependent phosphoribosyltransferase CobT n=1 Tax=Synechococcus sp. HK05 TaxID=2725975 RepID=UPI001C386F51|nr:TIGR00303 family protein [Synechococcus sp. HK05]MBV2351590.1 TIGR00303 family protein [Synechococcus sp. HK05]